MTQLCINCLTILHKVRELQLNINTKPRQVNVLKAVLSPRVLIMKLHAHNIVGFREWVQTHDFWVTAYRSKELLINFVTSIVDRLWQLVRWHLFIDMNNWEINLRMENSWKNQLEIGIGIVDKYILLQQKCSNESRWDIELKLKHASLSYSLWMIVGR